MKGFIAKRSPQGELKRRALQRRRRQAIHLLREGLCSTEVAARLGVSHRSVQLWASLFAREGWRGLRLGRSDLQSMLKPMQCRVLLRLLQRGPRAAGFAADVWTCALAVQLIEASFGVRYTRSGVWYLLRRLEMRCSNGSTGASANRA